MNGGIVPKIQGIVSPNTCSAQPATRSETQAEPPTEENENLARISPRAC